MEADRAGAMGDASMAGSAPRWNEEVAANMLVGSGGYADKHCR